MSSACEHQIILLLLYICHPKQKLREAHSCFPYDSIVTWHRDLPLQHCLAGNKHSHNEKGAAIQLHLHLAVQHTLLFLRYHWVSTAALATLCAHQYHCWSWEMKPHCILLTCFHFVWALFGAVFLKHLVSGSIVTHDFSVFSRLIILCQVRKDL